MRLYYLLFLLLFISTLSYSQNPNIRTKSYGTIQEIKEKIKTLEGQKGIENDSSRIELINALALKYRKTDKDTALYYTNIALTEASRLKLQNLIAVSLYNTGIIYEYHKDLVNAESNFMEWMKVRKAQGDDQYRWTLDKMRDFYISTRQKDKLEKNEEEWMLTLDRQLDHKEITPWLSIKNPTPKKSYHRSMIPVFQTLILSGNYFIAEKSLHHMMDKCPDCCDYWGDDDMVYGRVEVSLIYSDTAALAIWYQHRFDAMAKYKVKKEVSLPIINSSAQMYVLNYRNYSQYFDKFYPMMMRQAYKIGGHEAVYDILSESKRAYISDKFIKLKVTVYLLSACIKLKDKTNTTKMYRESEIAIKEYLSRYNSKSDLRIFIAYMRNQSKDGEFVKWCNDQLEMLK